MKIFQLLDSLLKNNSKELSKRVLMYLYKKFIWKSSKVTLVSPQDFIPNKVWKKVLELDI
jgi:hypothetical protein